MNVQRIPAVIIQTPNSERFLPLFEVISESEVFEPVLIVATMGYSLPGDNEDFIQEEVLRYGRVLTQNERACAVSHSEARNIIAQSRQGGIVFEDDARVIDLEHLEQAALSFLVKFSNISSALGLLDYKNQHVEGCTENKPLRFRKLLAETPLAVATVLTPKAASEILKSAATSSQTADWPKSKCRFLILSDGCVRHGDTKSGSVIGDTAMRVSGKTPQLFSPLSLTSMCHRLLQKLDTILIPYYQSKCPFCSISTTI
jgi:GR25 family glycosyltransferase involved in LPS biosynthesis